MKLKDFLFSTLPRSRKSKRKQPKSAEKKRDPETDDVIIRNHNLCGDVISTFGNNHNAGLGGAHAQTTVSYDQGIVSADFRYYADTPLVHQQTLSKTPSNTSESGFEDGYDQHLGPSSRDHEQLTDSFHTFPRRRTRIKTNPWLTSHSNTMTSSAGAVRAPSPYYVMPTWLYGTSRDMESSCCTGGSYDSYYSPDSSSGSDSPLTDHVTNYMTHHMTNLSNHVTGQLTTTVISNTTQHVTSPAGGQMSDHVTNNNNTTAVCHTKQNGVVEGDNLVINLNTGDIYVKPQPIVSPIDFRYERDLDATLERASSDQKCFYLTQEDLAGDHVIQSLDSDDSDSDREGTLTRNRHDVTRWSYRKRKYRMDAILARRDITCSPSAYSPYRRPQEADADDTPNDDEDDDVTPEEDDEEDVPPEMTSLPTDSAYDSGTANSSHRPEPATLPLELTRHRKWEIANRRQHQRSLAEIRDSLRDKVYRLREEKRVVDEKVKAARDEEHFRRREKARIEQEVTSYRKHVLLDTLSELKASLEEQSRRLQEAYDDVIDMKWASTRLRRLRNTTL